MMIPFATVMYVEPVEFFRNVPTTRPQGASQRHFDPAGVEMMASVQPAELNLQDSQGRWYVVQGYRVYTEASPGAVADDKFEWRDRHGTPHSLAVQGPSTQGGIGGVTWVTECVETRS